MPGLLDNFLLGAAGVGDSIDHALGGDSTLAASVAASQGTGTDTSNAQVENSGGLTAAANNAATDVGNDVAAPLNAAAKAAGTAAGSLAKNAAPAVSQGLWALIKSLWWLVLLIAVGLVAYVLTITGGWTLIAAWLKRKTKS
jgi:hypothetical protein